MGKKKMAVNPELIHLNGIRILRAHFEMNESIIDEPHDISDFQIGLKSESGFNYDENAVRFRLFVKIVAKDDKEELMGVFGEYLLEYNYVVENLIDFVDEEEGGKSVSSMLGATIAGISYSTARGIILDRTQATEFNGVLLPVIDPHRLLNEDSFSEM